MSMTLEQKQPLIHFTSFLTLAEDAILWLHRWSLLTGECLCYTLHPAAVFLGEVGVQELHPNSAALLCSGGAMRLRIDCNIAQSTYCYSHPNHIQTIWCGHASVDINNPWSCQVYFMDTRSMQHRDVQKYTVLLLTSSSSITIQASHTQFISHAAAKYDRPR